MLSGGGSGPWWAGAPPPPPTHWTGAKPGVGQGSLREGMLGFCPNPEILEMGRSRPLRRSDSPPSLLRILLVLRIALRFSPGPHAPRHQSEGAFRLCVG